MATKSNAQISIADSIGMDQVVNVSSATVSFDPTTSQPSTVGASLLGVTTTAAGTLSDSLYLTEVGDRSAISVADIHQGQLGDCFLLAAVGELAIYDPAAITKMIGVNANGTESVALFEAAHGGVPGFGATQFSATSQTVTNSFSTASVNNGATQDAVGNSKEIWVQVLEKAYAQANGGYTGIANGGNPCIALQQLTGHTAQWESAAAATTSSLTADVNAGDLIVMDTAAGSNLPAGLVGDHAYMFDGLVNNNGVSSVRLANPWGFDQPALIPVSQLGHDGIVEVDIGHTH